jgi:hypothetical protein
MEELAVPASKNRSTRGGDSLSGDRDHEEVLADGSLSTTIAIQCTLLIAGCTNSRRFLVEGEPKQRTQTP